MVELEKKMLLSKNEYQYLLDYFCKDVRAEKQINYYFDTDALSMNRQGITCRIRLKEDKYEGTMKRHILNSESSVEREVSVRNGIIDNGFIDLGLDLQGELTTARHIAIKTDYIEMVLDKNDYLNYTDFELEIEYIDGYEYIADGIIESVGYILNSFCFDIDINELINRSRNAKSKSDRFFERKILMRGL